MRQYIQIAYVLLAELICIQCVEKIFFSKQLIDDVAKDIFIEFTDVSIRTCIENCKRSRSCQYVEYRPRYHLCSLLRDAANDTVHGNVLSARGYVSSKKSDWDMTGYTGCQNCGNNQFCIGDGTSCETKVCDTPPDIQSSTTIGNMFNVGDRVSYSCDSSSDRFISECSPDGSWNTTGINCNNQTPPTPTGIIGSGWFECRRDSYLFVRDLLTWYQAKVNCELLGSQLAKIKNDGDFTCVKELFATLYGDERVKLWIGANDIDKEGTFSWADGELVVDYTNWNNNQPDNALGNENCVAVGTRFHSWNDMDCDLYEGSICYLD